MNEPVQTNGAMRPWMKPIILVLAIATFGFVYSRYGESLTLKELASREQSMRGYEQAHPLIVLAGALVIYVIVSGLSIPGGAVALSLVYGSFFGFLKAVVIVSIASTAGATVAFLMSRYLFGEFIQRTYQDRLKRFNDRLEAEGSFYLFSLRLIPAVPFFMINLLMGLTKMKTSTFWWISQLGMLPGTMAYVYAGSTLKLSSLAKDGFKGIGFEFVVAFVILGLLPMAIKKTMAWVGPTKADAAH